MEVSNTLLVSMYCPKCGHKVIGKKREDGALILECRKCKAVMFSKARGKREINIKLVTTQAV